MALPGIHDAPSVEIARQTRPRRRRSPLSPSARVASWPPPDHTGHGSCGTMVLHETSHAMTSPIPPFTVPPAAIARAGVSARRIDRREGRG